MIAVPVLASCMKEEPASDGAFSSGERRVAYFNVTHGEGEPAPTKAVIHDGTTPAAGVKWPVSWAAADEIRYYTGKTSVSDSDKDYKKVLQSATDTVTVPVTYTDGDDKVVFFCLGNGIGGTVTKAMNKLSISDAVPADQDGTFSSYHIGVARKDLLTLGTPDANDGNVSMQSVSGFLKFHMSNLVFGGKEVKKIVLSGQYICGPADIDLTATPYTMTPTGSTNTITIDKNSSTFYKDQDYYVAILPRYGDKTKTFDVTFSFYGAGESTPSATAKISFNSQIRGKIIDLGDIWAHRDVKYVSSQIYPDYAAITKDMTKKVWLRVEPEDFSGTVTLSVDIPSGGPSVTYTEGAKETLSDGKEYRTFTLTPAAAVKSATAYTELKDVTFQAVIKNSGETATAATEKCVLHIGNFINLGIKTTYNFTTYKHDGGDNVYTLWARGYMAGVTDDSGNKPRIIGSNGSEVPNFYFWGGTKKRQISVNIPETDGNCEDTRYLRLENAFKAYWGGDSYNCGGRYNADDGLIELKTEDDIAFQLNSSLGITGCRIPSDLDMVSLASDGYTIKSLGGVAASGFTMTLTSKVIGFTDVQLKIFYFGHYSCTSVSGTIDNRVLIWSRILGNANTGPEITKSGVNLLACQGVSNATDEVGKYLYVRSMHRGHCFPYVAVRYVKVP